jgi:hypothetical protein
MARRPIQAEGRIQNFASMEEATACLAAAQVLELRHSTERAHERWLDRIPGLPNIDYWFDLNGQIFALEHTRVEAFHDQMRMDAQFQEFLDPIYAELAGQLPRPGVYSLVFTLAPGAGIGRAQLPDLQRRIVEWVRIAAADLHQEMPDHLTRAQLPRGYESFRAATIGRTEVRLGRELHWSINEQFDGDLMVSRIAPDQVDQLRQDRLSTALDEKCPKLAECIDMGARTILILQNIDIALSSFWSVGDMVCDLLEAREDKPDEVFYVDTTTRTVSVTTVFRDNARWPDQENERVIHHHFERL